MVFYLCGPPLGGKLERFQTLAQAPTVQPAKCGGFEVPAILAAGLSQELQTQKTTLGS
jgi:hypothetical protein